MTLRTRECFEREEQERLATYAARAGASRGRAVSEPEDPYRTIFQRDRDRILHASAFRRLEYKTQVFVNHQGDYYRTRLTHSLEVAQIARAMCRSLRLNEDLAEAVALAHDLGHTPFGHAGEDVMSRLMEEHGGFEHNHQSYRVVTQLEERYAQSAGLNLSFEVLEGIVKHAGEYDAPRGITGFAAHEGYPSLEAQIVNLADEIAYTNHDLDDGLTSGMITLEGLDTVPVWHDHVAAVTSTQPGLRVKLLRHSAIRGLIRTCIVDLMEETTRRLTERRIATLDDIRARGGDLAAFSTAFAARFMELKRYLFDHLYRHYRVERMAEKARGVVKDLFEAFQRNPRMLPTKYYERIQHDSARERHICDYIAGMTDRYAFEEHRRLFDPRERV